MGDIEIVRHHAIGAPEMRRRLLKFESKLSERLGLVLNWTDNVALFDAGGVSGRLAVYDDSVCVDIKLAMMLRPLAGVIREKLETTLDSALA